MKILFQEDDGTLIREESISEAEYTAAMTDMLDFTEWIANAFKNKSRQMIDYVVEQSGRGSKHTSVVAKEKIINDLKKENSDLVKPAKDRNPAIL